METNKILENILQRFPTCHRMESTPIRFKVSLPTEHNPILEDELSLYLMIIHGESVLHIVDIGTHFSSAIFIDKNFEEAFERI